MLAHKHTQTHISKRMRSQCNSLTNKQCSINYWMWESRGFLFSLKNKHVYSAVSVSVIFHLCLSYVRFLPSLSDNVSFCCCFPFLFLFLRRICNCERYAFVCEALSNIDTLSPSFSLCFVISLYVFICCCCCILIFVWIVNACAQLFCSFKRNHKLF